MDFRSSAPIYTQVVEQIRGQVLAGRLKPGDQLPTVRQLAAEVCVQAAALYRYARTGEVGLGFEADTMRLAFASK